jgi:dienelactone hydrolase
VPTASVRRVSEPRWKRRFRAPSIGLPSWARNAPERCTYGSDASGTLERYTWDRASGVHRQATRRPEGTTAGVLTPDGTELWWFDDAKGNELGVWRTQPFDVEPPHEATLATDLEPGYSVGLSFAPDGAAAIGVARDGRHRVSLVDGGTTTRVLHDHTEAAAVGGWSHDGTLLVYLHAEHGDNRNPALRVVTRDGDVVGDLWDGPGQSVTSLRWSPVDGDQRLLVAHVRRGYSHPAIWDPASGEVTDLEVDIDGELLTGDWYPDAAAALLVTIGRGRGQMLRHELASSTTTRLDTPTGAILGARVRPDGEVWRVGSNAAHPVVVHCGDEVLRPPGEVAPDGVPYDDLFTEGPGGTIHSFVARPEGDGPHPTVFHVHGGPAGVDGDYFQPVIQAWVDHGYAVVMVNYRGSSGYGKAWLDAIVGKPGYRELEDIAAVRQHVVDEGIADVGRLVLNGGSWGGYLTLLGLGTQPDEWAVGVAAVPLASLRDHYHQQSEPLQAYWRSLFGGTPETLGTDLDDIDPIRHVEQIAAPVFVLVGDNDPRCPLEQVLTYVEALDRHGVSHELYRYDAGHGSMVVEEQIDLLERCLDFTARHLGTTSPITEE